MSNRKPQNNKRSHDWPEVRAQHLREHPACAACGRTDKLEAHHIRPFHLQPELELEPSNLITLCEHPATNDHLAFGHLRDYRAYNPDVVNDTAQYLASLQGRLYD